jgi:hypothetical protein
MRREFSAISAFSMFISCLAAIVLCLQVAQVRELPDWHVGGATLWTLELAIFGVGVYIWQKRISMVGWLLGIGGLLVLQLALSTTAGAGLALVQSEMDINAAIPRTFAPLPRLCAALFSLMVFYPLRVLLPVRPARVASNSKRFANSAAVSSADSLAGTGERAVLLVTGTDKIPVWQHGAGAPSAGVGIESVLPLHTEGKIELPLRRLLELLPQELLDRRADHYRDSHRVSVPLEVILPQLRDAQVYVKLSELHRWLPAGVMKDPQKSASDEEDAQVLLPLELVVPELPAEALELPAPSPPAWAELDAPETVSFATI